MYDEEKGKYAELTKVGVVSVVHEDAGGKINIRESDFESFIISCSGQIDVDLVGKSAIRVTAKNWNEVEE
jgi:hypothetical protein